MQIRFDGPPSHVSGRFIEVEDENGCGIKVGEWRQDGSEWLLVIPDVAKEAQMSGSIGEKLDQIIAEAEEYSNYHVGTDDAFRLIVKLAEDAQGTADRMLERLLLSDRERLEIGAAQLIIEDLTGQLARAHQVQDAIRRERGYAEDGRRRGEERLHYVAAQLSALHDEFRTAAQRLKFVANWLTNTYAKGNNQDAIAARGYAAAAKEVLDKGLDWLVDRNRGRGVMDSTAASKSAGAGSSPAARARPTIEQSCMVCSSHQKCPYTRWSTDYIWLEVKQRLERLASSDDVVWNVNAQRAILNLMWHYREREVD